MRSSQRLCEYAAAYKALATLEEVHKHRRCLDRAVGVCSLRPSFSKYLVRQLRERDCGGKVVVEWVGVQTSTHAHTPFQVLWYTTAQSEKAEHRR